MRPKPEHICELLLAAGHANPDVLDDPNPDVIFTDYGDNSINLSLRVWTASKAHMPTVLKSDLYFALFKTFNEQSVELPFPQRDLHLRSSDITLPLGGPAAGSSTP